MAKIAEKTDMDLLAQLLDDVPDADLLDSALRTQVAAAIAKERIARKMNQAEFAEFMGKTQSTISKWENGSICFSTKLLAEIAVKLDMDVNIEIQSSRIQAPRREGYAAESSKVIAFSDTAVRRISRNYQSDCSPHSYAMTN